MIRLAVTVTVTLAVGYLATLVYLCRDELARSIGPRSGM